MLLKQLLTSVVAIGTVPAFASAALVATLDFQDNGSDWTVSVVDGGIPITYELGGDPTKAGLGTSDPGAVTAHYRLNQEVFAPAGYTMSDVVLTGKMSARYDGYYTDARVGLDENPTSTPHVPFASNYHFSSYYNGGTSQFIDEPFTLDATGNGDYEGLSSVHVSIELIKSIAANGYWVPIDVSALELHATLTPIPEPASFALIAIGGCALLPRRRSTRA